MYELRQHDCKCGDDYTVIGLFKREQMAKRIGEILMQAAEINDPSNDLFYEIEEKELL
jgi:hypothetical protein